MTDAARRRPSQGNYTSDMAVLRSTLASAKDRAVIPAVDRGVTREPFLPLDLAELCAKRPGNLSR